MDALLAAHAADLAEAGPAFRFFDRGDYYTVVRDEARELAARVYHSSGALKHHGDAAYLTLSRQVFASVLGQVLGQDWGRVRVLSMAPGAEGQPPCWRCSRRASPGDAHDLLDALPEALRARLELAATATVVLSKDGVAGVAVLNAALRVLAVGTLPLAGIEGALLQEGVRECQLLLHKEQQQQQQQQQQKAPKGKESPPGSGKRLVAQLAAAGIATAVVRKPSKPPVTAELLRGLAGVAGLVSVAELDAGVADAVAECPALAQACATALPSAEALGAKVRLGVLAAGETMHLSPGTFEALALLSGPGSDKTTHASLQRLLGAGCRTAGGQRLLERWLRRPSTSMDEVRRRHELVGLLKEREALREALDKVLRRAPDTERLALTLETLRLPDEDAPASKIVAAVRRALSLAAGLFKAVELGRSLKRDVAVPADSEAWRALAQHHETDATLKACEPLEALLARVLDATRMRGGQHGGYQARVDPACDDAIRKLDERLAVLDEAIIAEARSVAGQAGASLLRLRAHGPLREESLEAATPGKKRKKRGAVLSLERSSVHGTTLRMSKADHEAVFGKRAAAKKRDGMNVVSRDKSGVRFRTDELARLAERHNRLSADLHLAEAQVVRDMLAEARPFAGALRRLAGWVAALDVLAAFAQAAHLHDYCQPEVSPMGGGGPIEIVDGRHALVEQAVGANSFVANGLRCRAAGADAGAEQAATLIISGPNMGGKSTFIRQVALMAVMSQIGSFVPASRARLPLFDSVLARVGAADCSSIGASTFMVEMRDVASILARASPASLVVIDEVGRGTSVNDGLGLAYAIAEFLAQHVQCVALIATHFHELSQLAALRGAQGQHLVRNLHLRASVVDGGKDVVMLHEVLPGATDKSYGVAVAKMAGFPPQVVSDAQAVLERLQGQ